MVERRRDQRWPTLKTGKLRTVDVQSGIDCAILDISEGGACILIPVGAAIPDSFDVAHGPRSNELRMQGDLEIREPNWCVISNANHSLMQFASRRSAMVQKHGS